MRFSEVIFDAIIATQHHGSHQAEQFFGTQIKCALLICLIVETPKALYHYIQYNYIKPDFVVDISDEMDQKINAVMAYSSQFFDPISLEPETPISSLAFLDSLKERAKDLGRMINVNYAEGFTAVRLVGIKNLKDLL